MQHRQKDRPLHGKAKATITQEVLQNGPAAGLLPKTLEDQTRSKVLRRENGKLALLVRGQQQGLLSQARPGREQGIEAGTVMGHEFIGEIIAVGDKVENVRVGDRVCAQCDRLERRRQFGI